MKINLIDKQEIIDTNKRIISDWNQRHPSEPEVFDVSLDRLDEVLEIVKNADNKENERKNIILKASYLMGGLAWSQPFSGSNKRTAVLITSTFLHNNGLSLTIPEDEEYDLRNLLYEIQEDRSRLDQQTMTKLILYISKNTIKA